VTGGDAILVDVDEPELLPATDAVEIRAPKYGSERAVYLADGLIDIVRAHLVRLAGRGDARWLFHRENDNPPHQNTVGYWWRKARTAAGCPSVKLHDLRHFYASGLIAVGCDVVTRSACARAQQCDHHPQHLRASLADRGGPHPGRCCGLGRGSPP
jgi:integrase